MRLRYKRASLPITNEVYRGNKSAPFSVHFRFENSDSANTQSRRHDISRRKRGIFDKFIAEDMDGDGDTDFVSARGNSAPFDGVFWLEQVLNQQPVKAFTAARPQNSAEMPLP